MSAVDTNPLLSRLTNEQQRLVEVVFGPVAGAFGTCVPRKRAAADRTQYAELQIYSPGSGFHSTGGNFGCHGLPPQS